VRGNRIFALEILTNYQKFGKITLLLVATCALYIAQTVVLLEGLSTASIA